MDLDFLEERPPFQNHSFTIGIWAVIFSIMLLITPTVIWNSMQTQSPRGHWHMTNILPDYPEIVSIDFIGNEVIINRDEVYEFPKVISSSRSFLLADNGNGDYMNIYYKISGGNLFLYDRSNRNRLFSVGYHDDGFGCRDLWYSKTSHYYKKDLPEISVIFSGD